MQLHGIHHITAITADARRNVDFYARLLGLRMVKKTVNFDAPDYYHLYYGDETGAPGSIMTFFEFPGRAEGQGRRRHDPPRHLARGIGAGARLLGAAARSRGHRDGARAGCAAVQRSRGPRPGAGGRRQQGPAAGRRRAGHPGRDGAARIRRRARVQRAPGGKPAPAGADARLHVTGRRRGSPPARGATPGSLPLRPAAHKSRRFRAPARCTTSPGRPRTRTTRPGASG